MHSGKQLLCWHLGAYPLPHDAASVPMLFAKARAFAVLILRPMPTPVARFLLPSFHGTGCPACLSLQSELDAQRARAAVLPPLQSVLELTTAFRPPERSGGVAVAAPAATTATAEVAAAPVGRALPDGSGRLADGTWWEKKSGIERGKVRAGFCQQ